MNCIGELKFEIGVMERQMNVVKKSVSNGLRLVKCLCKEIETVSDILKNNLLAGGKK